MPPLSHLCVPSHSSAASCVYLPTPPYTPAALALFPWLPPCFLPLPPPYCFLPCLPFTGRPHVAWPLPDMQAHCLHTAHLTSHTACPHLHFLLTLPHCLPTALCPLGQGSVFFFHLFACSATYMPAIKQHIAGFVVWWMAGWAGHAVVWWCLGPPYPPPPHHCLPLHLTLFFLHAPPNLTYSRFGLPDLSPCPSLAAPAGTFLPPTTT